MIVAKFFFRSSFRLSSHRQLVQIGRSEQREEEKGAVTFGGSLTVCEKERVRLVLVLFSVGAETESGAESLSSILQRDRILSSFSMGMQKGATRTTD